MPQALLEAMGMDGLEFHPGYQLLSDITGRISDCIFGVNELPGNGFGRDNRRVNFSPVS